MTDRPVAAVTGASGYLGSRVCLYLESRGWRVIRLARSPKEPDEATVAFDLDAPISSELRSCLGSADVLVHAAYDLSLTRSADIWRVNVDGTRRLLNAAADAGTSRMLVVSSMSAFEGTTQLYGRAKLDIEAIALAVGGCAVRPGLVYGDGADGMAGALRRMTRLPIVPAITGGHGLYTVHEEDLMEAIVALVGADILPSATISVAHPCPVSVRDLLIEFGSEEGRSCRVVSVPWRLVYWFLRVTEALRVRMPFRADSVLGLIRTAPGVGSQVVLGELGVSIASFGNPSLRRDSNG